MDTGRKGEMMVGEGGGGRRTETKGKLSAQVNVKVESPHPDTKMCQIHQNSEKYPSWI